MMRWNRIALVAALLSGCLDPVVGGRCDDGFEFAEGQCVPRGTAPRDAGNVFIAPVTVPDADAPARDVAATTDRGSPATDAGAAVDIAALDVSVGVDVPAALDVPAQTDDAGTDAEAVDALTPSMDVAAPDVSEPADAGSAPDAGTAVDAGGAIDVGSASDTWSAPDAAEPADIVSAVDIPPGEDVAVADDTTAAGDAAPGVCEAPNRLCGGACVDTQADANHCGGCGSRCPSGEFCFSGTCAPQCPTPFSPCGSSCIDLGSDADNCGACGYNCGTGVCNAGQCRRASLGHLALIGHDYSVGRYAQNAVVGNAVFMNSATPRIVMLTTWAPSANVTNTLQAIQQVAQGIRLYTLQTHRNYTTLPALLSVDRFDVVIVLAQTTATDDELGAAARILGPSLNSFVRAGGVAVVLDGEGANAGTWQIATASGLISIDGRSVVTGETLAVENGTDALGIGLPLEYRAERSSVSFRGASAGMVVSARSGAVVIHRGYSPGC